MSHNPLVIIPGPARSILNIVDDAGKTVKQAWPVQINQQAITDTLKSSLMKMMLLRKDAGFSDSIAKILQEAIDPLSVNPDGTKKYNVQPYKIRPSFKVCSDNVKALINKAFSTEKIAEVIGEENIFFFAYDMFGDVYTVADELDEFISEVKKNNACNKVDLLCVSLGGVVLKAYLDVYSQKNEIEKVISVASLMNGTSLIADAFENNLTLNDTESLISLMGEKGDSFSSVSKMLPPDAIENTITKCIALVKDNLLCNCTMMWACIPDNRYDAIYASSMKKGGALDKKISKLHNYSVNLNHELKALQAKGMKFYQFCGYGKNLIPISSTPAVSSDGIVETSLASFGAVCNTTDSEPDCTNCLFPDTTRFFKNEEHFSIQDNEDLITAVASVLKDLEKTTT